MLRTHVLAASAGLAACAAAHGQWISFDDETRERLILTNVGTPDFQEKDLASVDLDHDGWIDVVVARKVAFSNPGERPDLILMNEEGVLTDRTAEYAPGFLVDLTDARDVVAADVDNDTWEDVIICTYAGDDPKLYRNLGIDENGDWLGLVDESDRFGKVGGQSLPFQMCAVSAGDVNGDGWLDLYFSACESGDDLLFMNNGDGTFEDETVERLGALASSAFGVRNFMTDIDHDGDEDILKMSTLFGARPFSLGLFVLWNSGDGTFAEYSEPETVSPYNFALGDLNDDGDEDIYVLQDSQDRVDLVTVNGPQDLTFQAFLPEPSPRTSGFGGNVSMADVDGDDDLDALVGPIDADVMNCGSNSRMALLQNDGSGLLSDPWPDDDDQNFHLSSHDQLAFDVNNDGCVDLFMGLCEGYAVMIQNCGGDCYADFDGDGDLTILDFVAFQQAFASGDDGADANGDGNLDVLDFVAYQTAFQAGC